MPDIHLSVPYVTQVNIGGHAAAGHGRTERMGCWYAAVSMLGFYREAGPRLGVPEQYVRADGTPHLVDNDGIQPRGMGGNYQKLVDNEHLTMIPLPKEKAWSAKRLVEILRSCGPCYMRTKIYDGHGRHVGGHIIVLVGAKTTKNTVIVHDPAVGPNIEMSIDSLNRIFNWDESPLSKYSMMCKLPITRS